MHIIAVIILLGVLYLLFKASKSGASSNADVTRSDGFPGASRDGQAFPGLDVAFISGGKLFYKGGDGEVKQIHSPYIEEVNRRMEKSRERHAWKAGTSFAISASGQMRQFASDDAQIVVTSAQFDQNKTILYFLKDEGLGGLFSYNLETGVERRILHRQNLHLEDIRLDPATGNILCSSHSKSGVANIATLNIDGNHFRELTGGDTVDTSPSWVGDDEQTVVYQSTGIARNPQGYVAARGNATIQMLDLRSGKITAVLENPTYDFMKPVPCPDGNLHFIRRPFETPQYSADNVLLDILLFPFRLLRAIFYFLNFFSLMYSRKPLTGATGPAVHADMKDILLQGKRIDAEKALRSEASINGVPSLVPKSWQLVKRTRQGDERVLATNVASYDITSDAQIIYSNGRGVFLLGGGDTSTLILKSDLVGEVLAEVPLVNRREVVTSPETETA